MAPRWARLGSDESGQTFVEYALLIALVAIGLIAASVVFQNELSDLLGAVEEAVRKVPNGCSNPVPGEQNPNC